MDLRDGFCQKQEGPLLDPHITVRSYDRDYLKGTIILETSHIQYSDKYDTVLGVIYFATLNPKPLP